MKHEKPLEQISKRLHEQNERLAYFRKVVKMEELNKFPSWYYLNDDKNRIERMSV